MKWLILIFLNLFLFVFMMVHNGRSKNLPKPPLKLPQTSSLKPLDPTGLSLERPKFIKGDLVTLNIFGQALLISNTNKVSIGVIVSNAHHSSIGLGPNTVSYWVYDVFVGNELITSVPQNFIKRIITDEYEEDSQ